jgi:magnesium chelatase subunit D
MKKALLLNAINTRIGGVLLRGQKGTAKSMAVRALSHLLPWIEVTQGCIFQCDPARSDSLCDNCAARLADGEQLPVSQKQVPVVELPVGATEDRLVGTLDIEKAIKSGEKHFEPGLLALANRGILYIDEVNLLDDHLVDVLLDAAAMGRNFVEREGISFNHPAQFILVGTMNPEEGDLRPQLLDRFGLAVDVQGLLDLESRAEVVRRRIAFENNPAVFAEFWEPRQEKIRQQVIAARQVLPSVELKEDMLSLITQICLDFGVDGHRADIVIHKTATTLAAYYGRTLVNENDVREAAELALLHRRRRQPFEEPEMNTQQLEESVQNWHNNRDKEESQEPEEPPPSQPPDDQPDTQPQDRQGDNQKEETFEADQPYRVKPLTTALLDRNTRSSSGRRSKSITESKNGRYIASIVPNGKITDLALDATLRAAAPFQVERRTNSRDSRALLIESRDLRQKVREKKVGNLIIFVLDSSGSMAVEERMKATKGALFSLLLDAYQRRDKVGLVTFRGERAELALPPTNSVTLAQKYLAQLPTGGRTPLAHGLQLGMDIIREHLSRDKNVLPLLVLVSDGRANVSMADGQPVEEAKLIAGEIRSHNIRSLVIDTENGFITFGLLKTLCGILGGTYLRLEELQAGQILSAVQNRLCQN